MNPRKWDDAKIACSTCHNITTSDKLWAYSMAYTKESLLKELLFIFNNGSTQDLASFVMQKYQELEIPCHTCKMYNNYYIPKQS